MQAKNLTIEEIQRMLNLYAPGIKVGIHYGEIGQQKKYLIIRYKNKTEFPDEDISLNDLYRIALRLVMPNWIAIEVVCLEMIGKEVWIDQKLKVTIASMGGDADGTFIKTTSGRTYSTKNLWIKENELS